MGAAAGFAFVFACLVAFLGPFAPTHTRSISVAAAFATAAFEPPGRLPERVREVARAELVLGVQATPVPTIEPLPVATPEPTPAPAVATLAPLPDPPTSGIVIASWYGPGFYGNRTACGQVYTPEIISGWPIACCPAALS
jgi:hypothetical protein